MYNCPPVLFLVFNRPETTRQVFNAIRLARPKRIYLASDGARSNFIGEKEKVKEVHQIIGKIDWPCEVFTLFRDSNLGCKKAVSSAIDWFFECEEEGIILEDDCLPHPDFFEYCSKLLEHYRDDERIGLISGTSLVDAEIENLLWSDEDFMFSPYFSIWGWASWRRVWKDYDVFISTWLSRKKDVLSLTSNKKLRKKHKQSFDSVFYKRVDTWDYQLGYMMFTSSRLSIAPKFNLIENVGFGSEATHTIKKGGEIEVRSKMSNKRLVFPLKAPPLILRNENYLNLLEKLATQSAIKKIINYLIYFVKKTKSIYK